MPVILRAPPILGSVSLRLDVNATRPVHSMYCRSITGRDLPSIPWPWILSYMILGCKVNGVGAVFVTIPRFPYRSHPAFFFVAWLPWSFCCVKESIASAARHVNNLFRYAELNQGGITFRHKIG